MTFDVICMGRLGIDLYPLQSGVRLGSVTSFGRFLGGSAANVAVAAARHGRSTALISRTGADDFGRFLREELERLGVSSELVSTVEGLPTPITFCEIHPPDHFPITFYRYPKAPDMEIRPEELDEEAVVGARLFWITTTGLSQEPSRSAHHEALRMRDGAGLTVLDLDYREQFWSDVGYAREEIAAVLPQVDIVVGNLAECEVAVGESDPHRAGKALLERGPTTAIVKLGPEGVLGLEPIGHVSVPPVEIEVVNGLGAGDAFGGALCHGILEGWPLQRVLEFANTAGAIVASRLECSTAMPDTEEVMALLPRR
jgi:5-dehydro-2-deoxygluconokinase